MTPDEPHRPPGTARRRLLDFGRRGIAREVDREFRAHLQLKEDELMAAGMSREDAAREARRAFGDADAFASESRSVREGRAATATRREWWQSVVQDARIAMRGLRRAPAFTTVAVLTLALGIGANTAIFSVLDAVVLRGVPYRNPSQLVAPLLEEDVSISKQRLELVRERQRTMSPLAAYTRAGFTLTGSGDAEQLHGAMVTADLFDVLGVRPVLGRTFVEGEDRPGRSDVVVLGHGLWTQRFGSDTAILGRILQLNGRSHTVVGVMPPGFAFPVAQARLYTPVTIAPADTSDYVAGYLLMTGRLRPDVPLEAARTDLRRVVAELAADDIGGFQAGDADKVVMRSLRDAFTGEIGRALVLLLGAVAFVLLIACVNVANLLLARASARAREFAVRASLGAGRGRIVRQLLTESTILALAGAAAGVALAHVLVGIFASSIPSNAPGVASIGVDGRVLLFSLGLAVIVGVAFGLTPALRLSRSDANAALGGRGDTAGLRRHRLMRGLVVTEVALALVLAVGAGLVLESFRRLQSESTGFNDEGILSFVVSANSVRHPTEDAQAALFRGLFDRLEALPGSESVGAIHLVPLSGGNWNPSMGIEGRPLPQGATPREVDWRLVTPGYFPTMQVPLISGRLFDESDRAGSPSVALVSRSLAERYFPGEDPIGKRVRTFFEAGQYATIIGVVGDTKDQSLAGEPRPQIYRSFWQRPQTWMGVMVRTTGEPGELVPSIRAIVRELDPDAVVAEVQPLSRVVGSSIAQPRLMMMLLVLFGGLAVALGALGIYGVMAYVVQQRRPEIGIRMALGARPSEIRSRVVGDALRLAAIGLAAGALVAFWLTRLLEAQLHEVSARDPVIFAAGLVALGLVAVLASWIPARRAARTEPTSLMRTG